MSNSRWAYEGNNDNGNALSSFCKEHSESNADQRGRSLLKSQELKFASDIAASLPEAQTHLPDRNGPDLDHHFASFVLTSDGSRRILELDGTKQGPIDHGRIENDDMFLEKVAETIKLRFMEVDPSSIEFSLMALCKTV